MNRFVEGLDRGQSTLFPECLGDWVGEDNPVRVIEVFIEGLDLTTSALPLEADIHSHIEMQGNT
jgi:hypothetical protein